MKSALIALALVLPVWGAEVPRPSPELAIQLPNGQQLLLSQYRGKVVAVEFLLTTCPHCQQASRIASQLYKEYAPKGFQAIGVAFNDMAMMLVPDFIRDHGVTFPVGVASRDAVMSYLQQSPMMRMLVPQMVFIDRKGVIRAQYAGDDPFFADEEKNMRKQIESLLAEGGAAKKAAPKKQSKAPGGSSQGVQ